MPTFFDELGKTLTDKGKEAAQKAKEVAEILQLKSQLSSEKSKLYDIYTVIGKMYFDEHQEDAKEEYKDFFTEINNISANITALEEKIGRLDGSKMCEACGAVLDQEDAFCSKCGTATVAAWANSQEAVKIEDIFEEIDE